jgi:hypothetical protein
LCSPLMSSFCVITRTSSYFPNSFFQLIGDQCTWNRNNY